MRAGLVAIAMAGACGARGGERDVAVVRPASAAPGSAAPAATDGPAPTQAEYARLLIAALARRRPGATYTFDPAHALVTSGSSQVAITNLHAEYVRLPAAERAEAIERVATTVSTMATAPLDPAELVAVLDDLRPVIRAGLYFDHARAAPVLAGQPAVPAPAARAIGEVTAAGLAIDTPTAMEIVTEAHLARWGLTFDQAMTFATSNFVVNNLQLHELEPGLWTSTAHDNYDVAVLLVPREIERLGLRGGAVALIPNRDTVYLAGADDARALLAMAARVEEARAEPRPIHTVPLCLGGGGWRECEPAPTPEVRDRMHALATLGRQTLYGEQQPRLQEQLGDETYVATFAVAEDPHGRLSSATTWVETVPMLLPRTDYVILVVPDGAATGKPRLLGVTTWDDLQRVLGGQLTADGRSPPRWATGTAWPTATQLKQLALRQKIPGI